MTFLNPTALLALMAAALPIIIHFLNLKKLKKIDISSLAFIKEIQKTKIKRIKIRQLILLLLRILIVASIVIAFSKPALRSTAGFSGGAKTTAVIIIDNSYSMSVVNTGGSYFNQAKQAAETLLETFHSGDDIKIIFTCDKDEKENGAVNDLYAVSKIISAGQLSNVSVPLYNSIIKAGIILSQSSNVNKEVFIISDFQKSTIAQSDKEETNLRSFFNEFTRIFLLEVPGKKESNLSVTGLTANNQIYEPGKNISFSAVISNYSAGAIENTAASLFINGKRTSQQGISLMPGETKQINFETVLNESGLLSISVELEDDDIRNDNKRFLSVFVPGEINIVSFSDSPEDLNYLNLAIDAFASKTISINQKSFAQLNSTDISKYDLILLCGGEKIYDYSPLENYLASGGNILFFPGSKATLTGYNKLCDVLKATRGESIIINPNRSTAQIFDKMDFQHPVLTGIFENNDETKISSPLFFNYVKINPGSKNNIIGLSGGYSFLLENNSGRGKILQFTSAPVPSSTDLVTKAIFAPLIQKCISYLAVRYSEQINNLAGESISIKKTGLSGSIKAELPDKESILLNEENPRTPYLLTKTGQLGTYKFYSNDKLIDFSSLNFDAKESILERINLSDFQDYLKRQTNKSSIIPLDMKKGIKTEIEASRFGTELWKHFLLLALVLAVIEMIIAKTSKKDLVEMEKL